MTRPRPEPAVAAAAASAWAFAVLPAAYSLGCVVQHVTSGSDSSAAAPSTFLPLAATAGILSVATFAASWRWFVSRPEAPGRWLTLAVTASTTLLVALGVLWP